MAHAKLEVSMLGGFSIRHDQTEITDHDNRSYKLWSLLAYMIYHRSRSVSQEELVNLLWDSDGSTNPSNALKTILHRVRACLDQLYPGAGRELILRRAGSYIWNPDIPLSLDVEEFDRQCHSLPSEYDMEQRIAQQYSALQQYGGDFLPKMAGESWVIPVRDYFHTLYVQTTSELLPLLLTQGCTQNIISLCYGAVGVEPYNEIFYQYLMRSLLEQGEQKKVTALYHDLSQTLYDRFGVMPSKETRGIYREATRTINPAAPTLEAVMEQLQTDPGPSGALLCDYDFFQMFYLKEARSISRTGDVVHLCLFTVSSFKNQPLAKRSLELCMNNLEQLLCSSLRRGDIVSRYSASQFIVLLPLSNYENSCKICQRISKQFFRQYPHSPAALHHAVQPLKPVPTP